MLLEVGGPRRILRQLVRALRNEEALSPEELKKEIRYLWGHRHRMLYAQLKARGLPIASGAMESAIKQLSAQRLRQPGMKWTRLGADAVLTVRAAQKSQSLRGTVHRRHHALQRTVRRKYTTENAMAG